MYKHWCILDNNNRSLARSDQCFLHHRVIMAFQRKKTDWKAQIKIYNVMWNRIAQLKQYCDYITNTIVTSTMATHHLLIVRWVVIGLRGRLRCFTPLLSLSRQTNVRLHKVTSSVVQLEAGVHTQCNCTAPAFIAGLSPCTFPLHTTSILTCQLSLSWVANNASPRDVLLRPGRLDLSREMSADKTSNIPCCPRASSCLLNTNSISPFLHKFTNKLPPENMWTFWASLERIVQDARIRHGETEHMEKILFSTTLSVVVSAPHTSASDQTCLHHPWKHCICEYTQVVWSAA